MNMPSVIEALNQLEGFLAQDPDNDNLRAEAFEAALRAGRRDRAELHLQNGLASGQNRLAWQLRQAHSWMATHDWERASALLATLRHDPAAPPVLVEASLHDLALIALRQHRIDEGLALLAPIVDSATPAPAPAVQALWLRLLHHADRTDEGLPFALRWAKAQQLAPEAAGVASLMALDAGELALCRLWCEAALAQQPRQLEALVARASLALGEQSTDRAKALLEIALQLNPNDGRALSAMAFTELQAGDLPQARATFERSLQSMPEHIGTWHGLGWASLLQGELAKARSVFEHALDLDRNFAETHGGMAAVLARLGDREGAAAAIAVALRLDRQCLSAHYAQAVLDGRDQDPAELQRLAQRVFAARRERSAPQ